LIWEIAFSPDSKTVAAGGEDGYVHIWDVKSKKEVAKLDQEADVYGLGFSPDGRHLAAGDRVGSLIIWDTKTWTKQFCFRRPNGILTRIHFYPDGRRILCEELDKVILFDLKNGKSRTAYKLKDQPISFLSLSFDGKVLAAGENWGVKLRDSNSFTELATLPGEPPDDKDEDLGSVVSLAFSPDSKLLAVKSGVSRIVIWDLVRKKVKTRCEHAKCLAVRMAFFPNGKYLVSGGNKGIVRIWDVATGKECHNFKVEGGFNCFALSPDGKTIAAGRKPVSFYDVSQFMKVK
jgi:dipeptidyl aminopeptidase/acylaminoacyl peptidase